LEPESTPLYVNLIRNIRLFLLDRESRHFLLIIKFLCFHDIHLLYVSVASIFQVQHASLSHTNVCFNLHQIIDSFVSERKFNVTSIKIHLDLFQH